MSEKYSRLDRILLLGGTAGLTVLVFLAVRRLHAAPGDSYLSLWPLHGYEAVILLLLAFIAACIDVFLDWSDGGSNGR